MYFNPISAVEDLPNINQNELHLNERIDKQSCEKGRVFTISEFQNCKDANPKHHSHTWETFCEEFGQHKIRAVKDGPAWSPVRYAENSKRGNGNVISVCMAVIDVDDGTPHESVLNRFNGYACLVHSSFSHSSELEKYRIILPLSVSIPAQDWKQVWERINQQAGGCNDAATKDLARLYYKPTHPDGANHFVKIQPGVLLNLESLPDLIAPIHVYATTNRTNSSGRSLENIEGMESSGPDLNFEQGLREVVNRCTFMKTTSAQESQAAIAEPMWMAMISNACRFENSESWIHTASENHPEYSENETTKRIERYRNSSSPVTCHRIRELGFKGCPSGGCQKPNGEIAKSPAGLMGWMFHRQLAAAETEIEHLPEEYNVRNFTITPEGVSQVIVKDGEVKPPLKICSRLDVTALTRDHDSSNWGLELRFTDPDGVVKTWAMPKETLAGGNGDRYCGSLLKMGLTIESGKQARDGLAAYLAAANPEARALSVKQPGWFNNMFVLPDAAYGRSDERVVFSTNDPDEIKRFSRKGTLESWKRQVAAPCQGNSRAIMSICIGLAPPLLALLGEDNGGFHLRGNSSIGKSICLNLGSSPWGSQSLIRTWNMTVNGLEGVATMHNDIVLPLDELGQADAKAAGEAAYMLGNGQGKGRANKDGDSRTAKRWRNLVLSSGERSMADLMAAAGQLVMAGQEVRMIEIPADAGKGFGVFENIHGARSSQIFAESLKHAIAENHGHAGRTLVQYLANPDLQPRLIESVKTSIQKFVDANVPEDATGQVGRVARRFGLVAAAGELCIELGILPWAQGEAIEASKKCFAAWVELRGGVGNHETAQAIARVRKFVESHGESRFTLWTDYSDNNGDGKTINRAGFRRITNDGRTEYFVLPEVYKTEVCTGLNPTFVTKTLCEKGFLVKDSQGKVQVQKRLPGMGKIRVYHLTADLMNDGVSQAENGETSGSELQKATLPTKYIV